MSLSLSFYEIKRSLKVRVNQLEEQLSNTLRAVDKLTADIEAFREYGRENSRVVNAILIKMDDRDEEFKKRMDAGDAKFETYMEQMNKKWSDNDKKFYAFQEEMSKKFNAIQEQMNRKSSENDKKFIAILDKLGEEKTQRKKELEKISRRIDHSKS